MPGILMNKHGHALVFHSIRLYWNGWGVWNISSWKRMTHLSFVVNDMAVHHSLATQVTRVSAVNVVNLTGIFRPQPSYVNTHLFGVWKHSLLQMTSYHNIVRGPEYSVVSYWRQVNMVNVMACCSHFQYLYSLTRGAYLVKCRNSETRV